MQQRVAHITSAFEYAGFYACLIEETTNVWVGGAIFQSSTALRVWRLVEESLPCQALGISLSSHGLVLS